jgi:hypothetical protein
MSAKHSAAVALGKLGGSVKSPAKAAAARANGQKGGRPLLVHLAGAKGTQCGLPDRPNMTTYRQEATCARCLR